MPFEVLEMIDVDFHTILFVQLLKGRAANDFLDSDVINAAGDEWLDVLFEKEGLLLDGDELGLEHGARGHDDAQREEHILAVCKHDRNAHAALNDVVNAKQNERLGAQTGVRCVL